MMQDYQNPKGPLDSPFLITNIGSDGKTRFLAIAKHHILQNSFQVVFEEEKHGPNMRDQLWYVERSDKENHFRIRHDQSFNILNKNLYLTLVKSKEQLQNQYSVELTHLHQEEGNESQLWTFDYGRNYTYCIKIQVSSEQFVHILPSGEKNNIKVRCGQIAGQSTETFDENYIEKADDSIRIEQLTFTPIEDASRYLPPGAQTQSAFIQVEHELVKKLKQIYAYIVHFKGKIYVKGSTDYECRIQQYATSSYPASQMSPYLIAYPEDKEDIAIMLRHAREEKKNVVARSGGHQYSGLSSGGESTIVLSMDKFSSVTKNEATGLIEVGPCVPLKVLSANLQRFKVSIPHGECPLVNVGGHAQTGGFGHIIHSFGLCLDYIQKFDIVLADGSWRTVERPDPAFVPHSPEDHLRIELFRGVLGGNAGSFGIVTKYYYNSIKDSDHPYSYGFAKTRLFSRDLLYNTMKVIQEMTQEMAKDKENGLKGIDIELTVSQYRLDILFPVKIPVLLLEGVYSDPDGNTPYKGQFKKILDVFLSGKNGVHEVAIAAINKFKGFSKYKPLSQLCGDFVRRPPAVTKSGRQFDLPYKKRTNATMSPLTDQFLTEFSNQVAYAASWKNDSIFVVVQMLFGGGGYYKKGQIKTSNGLTVTSIPCRDSLYFFVYDLFYDKNVEIDSDVHAEQLQDQMQETVTKYYNTPGYGEKRFFWACFGDFDMRKKSVVLMYYDSIKQYRKLQELKDKVDPGNLFNTFMTVKPTNVKFIQ